MTGASRLLRVLAGLTLAGCGGTVAEEPCDGSGALREAYAEMVCALADRCPDAAWVIEHAAGGQQCVPAVLGALPPVGDPACLAAQVAALESATGCTGELPACDPWQ